MKATHIGTIGKGIGGSDAYYLIDAANYGASLPAAERLQAVHAWFLQQHYQECRGPGQRFCTSVLVTPQQYSEDEFIGTARIRYDI